MVVMAHSDLGLPFEDVRRRLKRMQHTKKQGKVKNHQLKHNLEQSLLRQASLREDAGAALELRKEFKLSGVPDDVSMRAAGYKRAVKVGGRWYAVDEGGEVYRGKNVV